MEKKLRLNPCSTHIDYNLGSQHWSTWNQDFHVLIDQVLYEKWNLDITPLRPTIMTLQDLNIGNGKGHEGMKLGMTFFMPRKLFPRIVNFHIIFKEKVEATPP